MPPSPLVVLSLALAAASLLSACSSSLVSRGPGGRSSGRPAPPTTAIPATSSTLRLAAGGATTTTTSSTPTSTTRAEGSSPAGTVAEDRVIAKAWLAEQAAFYRASESEKPSYGPFLDRLVRFGPVYDHSLGYLSAQVDAGVVGPSTWRVGSAKVVSISGDRAILTGCAYDPGSHYRSSDKEAPPSLGGGAGLTASYVTLEKIGDTWLVYSSADSSPGSVVIPGPCRGFWGADAGSG